MNPSAILALIGELYAQVATLTEQNAQLANQLAEAPSQPAVPSS